MNIWHRFLVNPTIPDPLSIRCQCESEKSSSISNCNQFTIIHESFEAVFLWSVLQMGFWVRCTILLWPFFVDEMYDYYLSFNQKSISKVSQISSRAHPDVDRSIFLFNAIYCKLQNWQIRIVNGQYWMFLFINTEFIALSVSIFFQHWTEELMKLAYSFMQLNGSTTNFLQKAHTRLCLQVDKTGKIGVKK